MTVPDVLIARLFVAKLQLRELQQASADAKKAAREPGAEIAHEVYLSVAARLDAQADELREVIAALEKERDQYTKSEV